MNQFICKLWNQISVQPEKKKPWKPFLVKAGIVSTVTVISVGTACAAFSARYEILIDPQMVKCLPDYTVYLVDRKDTTPVRGEPFAFKASGIAHYLDENDQRLDEVRRYYEDGKKLLKIVDGMPGDKIQVREDGVKVNGEVKGVPGLIHSKLLKMKKKDFEQDYVLEQNKYFFAGRTFDSFDSRYWGHVDGGQILGRAYPLF